MEQMEFFGYRDTLAEERERLKREGEKGTHCRACNQFVKIYKRGVHTSIAVSLIGLYKMSAVTKEGYVHTVDISKFHPVCVNGRCELPMARWWGLIEEKELDGENDRGGKQSGLWRLTDLGIDFVMGRSQIPRQVYIYNNAIIGTSDETVTIKDCLKRDFDYDLLMAGEL